jgi:hypothetical protein
LSDNRAWNWVGSLGPPVASDLIQCVRACGRQSVSGSILTVIPQERRSVVADLPAERQQLDIEDLTQTRREIAAKPAAMFTDGRSPGVARLLGRAVLQLQQMLDDCARGVQNAGLLGSP